MNNPLLLRRRMMMQQETFDNIGYYKRGLLLHLDGIDYGGISGEWKDRISGRIFQIDSGTITLNSKGYYIGGCMRCIDETFVNDLISIATTGITYELAFGGNPNRERPYLLTVGTGGISNIRGISWYSYNDNKYLTAHAAGGVTYSGLSVSDYTLPQTVSLASHDSVYSARWVHNMRSRTSDGPNRTNLSLGYSDSIILGAWSTVIPYTTFYSVRIYKGIIPVDMAIHNQQIDNNRFNLGITE